jgi:hypothetical protein
MIDDRGKRVIEPGEFLLRVGDLSGRFQVTGNPTEVQER